MDTHQPFLSSCARCFAVVATVAMMTASSIASPQEDRTMDQNHLTTQQCTYRISHPARGPVHGTDLIRIHVRNGDTLRAFSLRDGRSFATHQPIPGATEVIAKLHATARPAEAASLRETTRISGAHVSGARDGGSDGGTVRIVRCQSGTDSQTETIAAARKAFLRDRADLWQNKQPKTYRFKLTDSRLRSRYPNGVEIVVKNQTAISAVDAWSQKPVKDLADLPFETLDHAYQWINQHVKHDGMQQMVIDYDDIRGFPVLVEWHDKDQKTHTVMIAQFKEK
jgi:hypothetical protein